MRTNNEIDAESQVPPSEVELDELLKAVPELGDLIEKNKEYSDG